MWVKRRPQIELRFSWKSDKSEEPQTTLSGFIGHKHTKLSGKKTLERFWRYQCYLGHLSHTHTHSLCAVCNYVELYLEIV